MSATLSADLFVRYFRSAPLLHITGRTFPVKEYFLEDILELSGYCPARPVVRRNEYEKSDFKDMVEELMKAKYSEKTIKALSFLDENTVDPDLIKGLIWYIVENMPPAGILIFAPGVNEISDIINTFESSITDKSKSKSSFLVLPLHSGIPPNEQHKIFEKTKPHVTKIIVATNIAETSITLNDIVYVIDTGKMKEMQYDSSKNMGALVETWIAKANAIQRAGRAGRVSAGHCFKLYTKSTHNKMSNQQLPEIHRTPLEHVCLQIKLVSSSKGFFKNLDDEVSNATNNSFVYQSFGLEEVDQTNEDDGNDDDEKELQELKNVIAAENSEYKIKLPRSDVEKILLLLIEPPPIAAIKSSLELLHGLGALNNSMDLTPLGNHLAKMPIDVRLGKMILYGAMFRCVEPVSIIAALLSNKSPFFMPMDKRNEAIAARNKFFCQKSDHISLLKVFQTWKKAKLGGRAEERSFLFENFLNKQVLDTAEDLQNEYINVLSDIGFVSHVHSKQKGKNIPLDPEWNENAENMRIVKGVICAGLYPNICRAVHPDKRYTQVSEGAIPKVANPKDIKYFTVQDRVFLHGASANFSTNSYESPWLAFLSQVKTNKISIRDSTMVSAYSLLLFGGEINVDRKNEFIFVGSWIKFHADLKIATLIKELRKELDKLLVQKVKEPALNISKSPVIEALLRLLSSEGSDVLGPSIK